MAAVQSASTKPPTSLIVWTGIGSIGEHEASYLTYRLDWHRHAVSQTTATWLGVQRPKNGPIQSPRVNDHRARWLN